MSVTRRSFLGAMTAAAGRRVLGANDRVQVGFIGYGLIGAQHVYDFKSQHDVDLAAEVVHTSRAVLDAEDFTESHSFARTEPDCRAVLVRNDVDER